MARKGSLLREVPILVVVSLVVSLLIKTFFVQFFYIPSGSMENTLQIKDRVAVNKLPFFSRTIQQGDIVVFRDPDNWLYEDDSNPGPKIVVMGRKALIQVGLIPDPAKQHLVKRVIGVGGDHIVCCNDQKLLTVNGVALQESYIFKGDPASDANFDVTVPQGKLWVMGDHRSASADSRFHVDDINKGMVPEKMVVGRVVAVIWPWRNIGIERRLNLPK